MPIFDIQAPNGKVLTIEAPDESNALAGAKQWYAGQSATQEAPNDAAQAASGFGRGLNKGLSDVVGAPVDLVNWGLGKVGLGSEEPFGGSRSIRRGLDAAGHAIGLSDEGRMAYERITDISRDARWAAAAGEAIGSALPFIGALGQASKGVNLAARAAPSANPLAPAIEFAARNPKTFLAGEAASAAGGAQGAAYAQAMNPDSEAAGPIGQLVGSVVNPVGSMVGLLGKGRDAGTGVASLFSEGARETRAGSHLRGLLAETAEDPNALIRNIETGAADPLAAGFTTADRSYSPTLLGLQENLAGANPDFARKVAAQREGAFTGLRNTVGNEMGGDVTALTRAAESVRDTTDAARRTFVEKVQGSAETMKQGVQGVVDDFVRNAEAGAVRAADNFSRDPEARGLANVAARDALNTSWAQGREVERRLWADVDLTRRVEPNGFRSALDDIRARMLPGEELPQPIREVARIATTSGRRARFTAAGIQNTRSRLLELGRDAMAGATPDVGAASIYRRLANGLLDDLADVPGSAQAREFSRRFHDTWDRTFAGQSQARTATGAEKVPESLTIEQALSGGSGARAVKLNDMREAGRPLAEGMADNSGAIRASQEAVIRDEIAKLRDPVSGRLDARKALDYAQRNGEVLQSFPAIQRDLQTAARGEQQAVQAIDAMRSGGDDAIRGVDAAAKGRLANAERAQSVVNAQSAFGRVLAAGEQPGKAVSKALSGARPANDYRQLGTLARSGGRDAMDGLRSATLDHVFEQAGKGAEKAGGFWHAVDAALTAPVAAGKATLIDTMRGSDALTATQKVRLETVVKRGVEMEKTGQLGRYVKDAGPVTDMFVDQIIRTLGANYGAGISVFGHAGATLSAAAYGSRVFQKLFNQMPSQKVADLLQRALMDDTLMRKLLTKAADSKAEPGVIEAIKRELRGAATVSYRPSGATMGAFANGGQQ